MRFSYLGHPGIEGGPYFPCFCKAKFSMMELFNVYNIESNKVQSLEALYRYSYCTFPELSLREGIEHVN